MNDNAAPKKKRRPPQKKWVNKFPCGHTKRRANCATCVALRKDRYRPMVDRFVEKYDRRGPDECWPWIGSADQFGRGYFYFEGKVRRAPRIAWMLHHGVPFPDDKDACHTCDSPGCVNPAHIWPGTESDNLKDSSAKGRWRTGPRPPRKALPPETVERYALRHERGESVKRLAAEAGVSYSKMWRLLRNPRKAA